MDDKLFFLFPKDGDMLNERDGNILCDGLLEIRVKVQAHEDTVLFINGQEARYEGGVFYADVTLDGYRNDIKAVTQSGKTCNITVWRLKNYTGKYRLSLDDNIWFLEDLAKNQDIYRSLFDNPYLGLMKEIHDEYGTKVHINIYYQTEGSFNLSMMSDKYKSEWKENADWLRLSFHANADAPDKPYLNAGYDTVKKDCEKVLYEIRRFAGEEVIGPVTTLHWGEATLEGCKALRDCGYRCLVADFNVDNPLADRVPVSYYLDLEQRRNIYRRFVWKDNEAGIIFVRAAIIIDTHPVERIPAFLDAIKENPHQSGYMDLLIHEQYFYPGYVNFQPNYKEKIKAAVGWAHNNGYKPAFLEECVFA